MTPMQPPFSAYGRELPAHSVGGCGDHGSSSGRHELLPSLHGQQVEPARPHAESAVFAISMDRGNRKPANPGGMFRQGCMTTGPCLDRQTDKDVHHFCDRLIFAGIKRRSSMSALQKIFAIVPDRENREAAIHVRTSQKLTGMTIPRR